MSRVRPLLLAALAAAAASPAFGQILAPLPPAATPSTPPEPGAASPPPRPVAPPPFAPSTPAAPLPTPSAPLESQAPPPEPAPPVATKSVMPAPVEVSTLAAPDAFSTPARDTGLPPTLWKGTSLQVVQAVLPKLADRPLSPAAAALARRILGTGAPGPAGSGDDPALVAARVEALITQGDPKGAAAILSRAPGVDRDPSLARVAAESALLSGDDARACQIEEGLSTGRADIYWVRLRTYCQAIAGKTAEAQLTLELAQSQAHDAVFGRLMAAKIAGAGSPGAPSLRNGLDYALSRSLGLDLSQAKPSPEVAAALSSAAPAEAALDLSTISPELKPFAQAISTAQSVRYADFSAGAGAPPKGKAAARFEEAMLLLAAYEQWPPTTEGVPPIREARAPVLRDLALDAAAVHKRMGETAMLALWTCAEEGPSLAVADRARIVWALREAGLKADARAFALEGLAGLK